VYKLDPSGKETVLYSFPGGSTGAYPVGRLVLDSKGNLYAQPRTVEGPVSVELYSSSTRGAMSQSDTASRETSTVPIPNLG
jgi:hypothetical protein